MTFEDQKNQLASAIPKNEQISWKRKQKNIEKLTEELEPLETQIMELMLLKGKIIDKIVTTRATMVAECVHPADMLSESADGSYMICKFCERSIGMVGPSSGTGNTSGNG